MEFLFSVLACLLLLRDQTMGDSGWSWFSCPNDVRLDHGHVSKGTEPVLNHGLGRHCAFFFMVLHSCVLAQQE